VDSPHLGPFSLTGHALMYRRETFLPFLFPLGILQFFFPFPPMRSGKVSLFPSFLPCKVVTVFFLFLLLLAKTNTFSAPGVTLPFPLLLLMHLLSASGRYRSPLPRVFFGLTTGIDIISIFPFPPPCLPFL